MSSKIHLAISPKKRKSPNSYIIGLDEVGRGPLAGPVTVAAVALPSGIASRISHFSHLTSHISLPLLRDSKKLTPKQREIWFQWVKKQKIPFATVNISPKIIDKINISNAANLAATKAALKLITEHKLPINKSEFKLDGGLKLITKSLKLKAESYIKGDEKIPVISLASIVAKVHRDKLMEKLSKKYPQYGFNKHKGYGTKLHYKNIKKHGISEIHRKSFLNRLT